MKADKIYIPSEIMDVPKNIFETKPSKGATEYVRKEALIEWLEKANEQALIEQGEYNTGTTIWEEVIDKLNSM